jgi:uncharacterized protein involved in exopolysaccharide biosynthesis
MTSTPVQPRDAAEDPIDWPRLFAPLWPRWKRLGAAGLAAAAVAVGISYLLTPLFESSTTLLPPQQQQSSAASALASLGALAGLGGGLNVKSPADQYVSLMESVSARDQLVDKFKLMSRYDVEYREQARRKLEKRTVMAVGKKDGIISITVQDTDPQVAAAMANEYVEQLRRLTNTLAVSEAQQRRVFFEGQLRDAKDRLAAAQRSLESTGIGAGALKAQPQAAGEEYAVLRAQATASEVKLEALRSSLAPGAPEVQREMATLQALRSRMLQLQDSGQRTAAGEPDYIGRYREYKYQETLFELLAKQYEIARVDEAREGALIQVIDKAAPAEHKSFPRRLYFAIAGLLLGIAAAGAWLLARDPDRVRAARA